MKNALLIIALLFGLFTAQAQDNKIKVLNLGIFHLGYTDDLRTTEYDEENKKNKEQIKEVNELIAKFKPTIIMVETPPKNQHLVESAYDAYLNNPETKTIYADNEIQLLAFEIGRLAKTKRIYAIDHEMGYDYYQDKLAKELNAKNYFKSLQTADSLFSKLPLDPKKDGLKKTLMQMNTPETRAILYNYNVDQLFYANSSDKFEGVDEAARFYQRNLRMFANICKIEADENDRILIISGGAHASFFHDFLSRSYIYEVEPVEKYLGQNEL
ncbi:DUF5694 domain-containing protein [Aureibacter tunicatorum]|uniref:TraB/GumN family protein n=1 Tax=Aureibacter tunicatorum TaxID=866807 RepID=A0AAE3XKK0_9BACT|nr:DUF5694 domain-containing protein [Aureibacter tunicatorum]MDR6239526.1 hypothetical protein [Aureibacter tunicatorum]BDD04003.1 hypothetical protein AUTU_14860 [Aureibacter tunicatorum]